MANLLTRLQVKNFRSLADVSIDIRPINVLFGPNGSGKSTLLDTIWFVRDCTKRGVDEASSYRSHGIGMLWDKANPEANISIKIETDLAEYEVLFGLSSGRIESSVGEILYSKPRSLRLIDRKIGSDKVEFYSNPVKQMASITLKEAEKLSLSWYLVFESESYEAAELDRLLHYVHFYHARRILLPALKRTGSESSHHTHLWEYGENVWSVLRNIHDKRAVDNRYDTIIDFMKKSFPNFEELLIEQTGPNSVYGSFLERGRRTQIQASGVSDGHLQMLIHLTALFSEGTDRDSLIVFDEPETSLHPYAISVFAEAVKHATKEWNKQVFIATHSPVLIGQFEPEDILATELDESGQTTLTRVSEMEDIKDLLESYDTGSLYMAEAIAPQSKPYAKEKGE
jgi:predicted ATPase